MMNRFSQSSSIEYEGTSKDPDVLYYNATIVNNTTNDTSASGQAVIDPPIRFNETRDTPLIADCSKYQFSIIRFVVNGGNKDLPLFIPAIQSATDQTDINLTEYGIGMTYSGSDGNVVGFVNTYGSLDEGGFYPPYGEPAVSGIGYVLYTPETKNLTIAPLPRSTANINYTGEWDSARTYEPGQIVAYSGLFYTARPVVYLQSPPAPPYTPDPDVNPPPNTNYSPPSNPDYWVESSADDGQSQDVSTRYYWVYTYSHWLTLVQTALERANFGLYVAWKNSAGSSGFYTSYNTPADITSWVYFNPTPIITWNSANNLFSIAYPGSYLSLEDQVKYGVVQATPAPVLSLYFNTNMSGLFANFKSTYYNSPSPVWNGGSPNPFGLPNPPPSTPIVYSRWAYAPFDSPLFPDGFTQRMEVEFYPTLGNKITPTDIYSIAINPVLIIMTQNYLSTSTLWSPIDALVFTTALLPIQNEAQAPPNAIGTQNVGQSTGISKSAFQPIITDVAVDLSVDPTGYRKMLYYAPTAEFRMADFQNSKSDIRNIDIQVFWRNRLDNNLYPLSMFNLSSVSIKVMFRKKYSLSKSERRGVGL
jgi:hypothetical protein